MKKTKPKSKSRLGVKKTTILRAKNNNKKIQEKRHLKRNQE